MLKTGICATLNSLRLLQKAESFPNSVRVRKLFENSVKPACTGIRLSHNQVTDSLDDIVEELCNGDQTLEKKLRVLMLEVEVMRQDGRCAPEAMNTRHWKNVLELPTRSQRNNYLLFLWKTEKAKLNQKAMKEERRKQFESSVKEDTREYPDDQEYGLGHQGMFLRIRDGSVNNFDNYRALQAMLYGQRLVIDCSYDDKMVTREAVNAAKQLTYVFGDNRIHKDPFDIHICNANMEGDTMEQLKRNIPNIFDECFPLHIHEKSYLDIFPKTDLVYLTPHCRMELTEFDHNAVYIVGCMVDKVNNEPLSLARAKRDGIKMAKLPLDRYLGWAPGSNKNLNINHMVPILLDLKITGDWEYAFRHVPRRKLMETKINAMENRLKKNKTFEHSNNFQGKKKLIPRTFIEKRKHTKRTLFDDDSV